MTYPAVPLALERKKLTTLDIVLGGERYPSHVDFLREILRKRVEPRESLTDAEALDLTQGEPLIITLPEKAFTLAGDTLRQVSVWSTGPIRRRTAAMRLLVKHAGTVLDLKDLQDTLLDSYGDLVLNHVGEDAPPSSILWAAMWVLSDLDAAPAGETLWKHPWDHPWRWSVPHVPIVRRLWVLYRDLGAWTFAREDNHKGAELFGCSASKYRYLQSLRLDPRKVDAAIQVLSAWRLRQEAPYAAALKIGAIFSS